MRQIIFDTETTGMERGGNNPALGHRIIEIGCVELIDRLPTKNYFHGYFNPDQAVDPGAFKVHGISDEFLADKPRFDERLAELEAYLEGADELIAHNMSFDQAFVDQELKQAKRRYTLAEKFTLVDSLKLARATIQGSRHNLDALCRRFNIDISGRELHGALLDAQLLAEVYLKLTGGQSDLQLAMRPRQAEKLSENAPLLAAKRESADWLRAEIREEEMQAHQEILAAIRAND